MENLFNALTAPEFRKIVLDSIDRAFDESGEFSSHITFPKVSWDFRLELKVYPSPTPEHTVVTKGQVNTELPIDPFGYKVINFTQKEGVDTPDLAREQNHLPIPTQSKGADGILGDKPVYSANAPEPAPVKIEVKVPEIQGTAVGGTVSVGDPVVLAPEAPLMTEQEKEQFYQNVRTPDEPARSVSIQTRANAGGVRVEGKGKGK